MLFRSVPISYAGIVSMIIAGGTIISSLFSDRLIRRVGTGVITAISVGMTAIALFGFSISSSFIVLCLWAIPYGLGAGSIDAALNNFVAIHYKSKHMSWLHCFWGIGATIGPYNITTDNEKEARTIVAAYVDQGKAKLIENTKSEIGRAHV